MSDLTTTAGNLFQYSTTCADNASLLRWKQLGPCGILQAIGVGKGRNQEGLCQFQLRNV